MCSRAKKAWILPLRACDRWVAEAGEVEIRHEIESAGTYAINNARSTESRRGATIELGDDKHGRGWRRFSGMKGKSGNREIGSIPAGSERHVRPREDDAMRLLSIVR